jgi:hypothetical protein
MVWLEQGKRNSNKTLIPSYWLFGLVKIVAVMDKLGILETTTGTDKTGPP